MGMWGKASPQRRHRGVVASSLREQKISLPATLGWGGLSGGEEREQSFELLVTSLGPKAGVKRLGPRCFLGTLQGLGHCHCPFGPHCSPVYVGRGGAVWAFWLQKRDLYWGSPWPQKWGQIEKKTAGRARERPQRAQRGMRGALKEASTPIVIMLRN